MSVVVDPRSFPLPASASQVVVTGVGIITAMGCGWDANVEGFRTGRTALRPVSVFDVSRQSVQIAGQAELPESLPANRLSPAQQRRLERAGRLLLQSAHEALTRAGVTSENAPDTLEMVLGTSAGAMAHGEAYYRLVTRGGPKHRGQLSLALNYQIPVQAALLAQAFGLVAPTTVISNACASGANAIGHAYQLIRGGRSRMVVAGGYDALSHLVFAGFDTLKTLSRTLPRPFDVGRDGLVLGEGAAVLVLEDRAHAEVRGAEILAVVSGYGMANDCHHLTQPHPEGLAALASMRMACAEAGITAGQVEYLNSHGTGTPLNDPAEAAAIATWAGEDAARLMVSSTKGAIGHLLGGAGAVEAAICVMALREGFVPANANLNQPDPSCVFDLVAHPRSAALQTTLTNSFGFGGSNASLVLQTPEAGKRVAPGNRPPGIMAVTGFGAVSPAGWGAAVMMEAVLANRPTPEILLEPRSNYAPGLPSFRVRAVPRPVPDRMLAGHPRLRRATPVSLFAAAAALEALGPERTAAVKAGELRAGIIYNLLNGSVSFCGRFYGEVLAEPASASPILFPETVFNAAASHLAAVLGITGPCATLVGDSAQFLGALDMASLWLDLGLVDLVLVVGAEEHEWLSTAAINLLKLQLPLAEGAACLVVERGVPGRPGIAIRRLSTRHPVLDFRDRGPAAAAARAALGSLDPDCLLVDDCCGGHGFDEATAGAWADWRGPRLSTGRVLGHGFSAASAWQCVAACQQLQAGAAAGAVVATTGANQRAASLHLEMLA